MKILFLAQLIMMLGFQNYTQGQQVKVFSKYNYYTVEKDVSVIGVLPDSLSSAKQYLYLFNGGKQVAASGAALNNLLSAKVPLATFAFGKTVLQYSVISGENTVIKKGDVDIIRLQPKANEVKIDLQTGGLIADGLPFFPFGFYCSGNAARLAEQEVSHGFNMIAPYQSNLADSYAERKAYMDRCAQIGMRVQYSVNSLIGSGHNGSRGLELSEDEKQEILKKEIIAFRDHPALLSWYINDEPDGQGRPPGMLENAYRMIHELDPYHPISIVFMLPSKFKNFRNTMDIAMTDPYPVPGPVDEVEHYVKQLNHDFQYEKSVWLVPQAFGGQEMWSREPTAKEIRLMTYLGLINGVKGIQYYTHAAGNLNPQAVSAWSACSDMAVEVNQMTPFLLSPEKSPPVITGDSQTFARSFSYKNDFLIIVINKENKPKSINIRLNNMNDEFAGPSNASLWFENREVAFDNGKIEDIIDALGTRVYFIKGKPILKSAGIYGGNLTINPGFEKVVSPGLPIGSNTKSSVPRRGDPGATFFADSRQSVDGMFSLRLVTPVDSGGNKIRLIPIVIKSGNSYSVSIWAKAKAQDKMPSFRIRVDGPNQEKMFTLTTEWQRYSFVFRTDSSWSAAIVTLDLLTAGTAWFDLIQVNPDPVISFAINKDRTAIVSIDKTIPGAELRYRLSNGTKNAVEAVYKQPFLVDKASTVNAVLFSDNKEMARASLFIPVNMALNKNVVFETKYDKKYTASGDSSLTDGILGSTTFKDGKWLGFLGRDVAATIDMQEPSTIHSVSVNFLCDPNTGIFLPKDLLLYTSINGKDFQLAGTIVNSNGSKRGEPYLKLFTINVKKMQAKYIRVVAKAFGEIPEGYLFKGTTSWLFVDEVLVE